MIGSRCAFVLLGLAFFLLGDPTYSEIVKNSDGSLMPRYQISCSTESEAPTILYGPDISMIYDGDLSGISYKDGRDLSFNPIEFFDNFGGTQVMRGVITDMKGRAGLLSAKKTVKSSRSIDTGAMTALSIFVLSSEWNCQLFDNKFDGGK